jgi:nucleotide-binding universal stress UspA family protein
LKPKSGPSELGQIAQSSPKPKRRKALQVVLKLQCVPAENTTMLPFRRILFPVDYSEPCRAVVPYALDMLHHFSAELTLVHAYGPAAVVALARSQRELTDPNFPEHVRAVEQQRLHEFALEMFPGQHAELITEPGEPGSIIHKVAQQQEADLIMLSTHGYGPVRRLLLGSVTAKVLHDATTVVWTGILSGLPDHIPNIPYRSIVCALDDTSEAEAVLKGAAGLAGFYRAQLSLLHVIQTPVALRVDFGPYRTELIDAADSRLRELKAKLGVDAPATVIDAPISNGVRDEVLRRKADLVITGRGHAQGAISRAWSHLYSVVRESPCPVMSI